MADSLSSHVAGIPTEGATALSLSLKSISVFSFDDKGIQRLFSYTCLAHQFEQVQSRIGRVGQASQSTSHGAG